MCFRFFFNISQIFLVLIKVRNWERPSWDQYSTTLTQSLPMTVASPSPTSPDTCPSSPSIIPLIFLGKPYHSYGCWT